jgi:hypothetical protein
MWAADTRSAALIALGILAGCGIGFTALWLIVKRPWRKD